MADISVTAASVAQSTGSVTIDCITAVAVTAGQCVYRDSSTSNQLRLAQKDGTLAESQAVGFALHAAAAGQPCKVQTSGNINLGATLTVGETYIVSATAGGVAPVGDVSTHFVTILGVAISASILQMGINIAGVAHA